MVSDQASSIKLDGGGLSRDEPTSYTAVSRMLHMRAAREKCYETVCNKHRRFVHVEYNRGGGASLRS